MTKTVFVGLSGGVDSSVAAALLKEQGYKVVGVYMKNWSRDLPGFACPWKEDYQDAKRVAVQLGIEFKMFDFENEYFNKVVQYMLDGFTAGLTPNPDIMCNQEIKFKLFLDTAVEQGADYIATGHYAQIKKNIKYQTSKNKKPHKSQKPHLLEDSPLTDDENVNNFLSNQLPEKARLLTDNKNTDSVFLQMAADKNKDQTYFLYRISQLALQKTLFPIGHLTKPQVRDLAKKYKLVTATKKESMGICFVGKVGIKEFLQQFLPPQPHGAIKNQYGMTIGNHDGAIFYTIGQRHGLSVGGGLPYYVTGKDMVKNEIYVTTDLQDKKLWNQSIRITSPHWISSEPRTQNPELFVRTRHRGPLTSVASLKKQNNGDYVLNLSEPLRALTAGQSAVLYRKDECVGGGIIC